jgi:hypothetical protein
MFVYSCPCPRPGHGLIYRRVDLKEGKCVLAHAFRIECSPTQEGMRAGREKKARGDTVARKRTRTIKDDTITIKGKAGQGRVHNTIE